MDLLRVQTRRSLAQLHAIGASVPVRIGIVVIALLANIGFYLPSLPRSTESLSAVAAMDKIVHILVFALTVWAVGRVAAPLRRFPIGWVAILALAHGALIELIQAAMPTRSASGWDLLADAAGIALGLVAWRLEQRRSLTLLESETAEVSPRG